MEILVPVLSAGDWSGETSSPSILCELTPRDVRLIIKAEEELNQVVFWPLAWSELSD